MGIRLPVVLFLMMSFGTISLASGASVVELFKDGKVMWTFHNKGQLRVSENCLKASCLALVPARTTSKISEDNKWVSNPAATLCTSQGARYEVGKRPNGDEDGVCVFKDQSFILGWDYYKKNEKKAKP